MGTFSIWHWLVVLAIVVLVFGTKKLRNLGGDLGSALKGFKEGMKDSDTDNMTAKSSSEGTNPSIEVEATDKTTTPVNQPAAGKTGFAPPPQNQPIDTVVPETVSIKTETTQKNEPEIVNISVAPVNINNSSDEDESKISIQTKG